MQRKPLSISELAIIAGTRAALGAGVGLLVADKLSDERRRGIGWALVGVGIISTIPIVSELSSRRSRSHQPKHSRISWVSAPAA
jgi:hypothetical protein